ncbi:MAG: LacI family DNA-binding transcriptional regulator [Lacunisphaera sp.]
MLRHQKSKSKHAATLADVGRLAGVSAMAVSAALNQARTSSRISDETRARILQAAASLNYRPNVAARALATRRMQTIGCAAVLNGGELNDYFLEVFKGVLAAASTRGQNTTVFTLQNWEDGAARLPGLCDGRIDGLILMAPTMNLLPGFLPVHTPFVSIHANSNLPGMPNIESDEEHGAYEMVRSLIARGHRRIMYLTGPAELTGAARRIRGYKRALASARIALNQELLVPAAYTAVGARDALRDWLQRHPGHLLPQAIFCANDSAAIGCMETLAELGLRIPDDISVAGFDDTLVARIAVPQLTSFRQPLREMGIRAVELLLARIGKGPEKTATPAKSVVLPGELVSRASVSAPPAVDRIVPVLD